MSVELSSKVAVTGHTQLVASSLRSAGMVCAKITAGPNPIPIVFFSVLLSAMVCFKNPMGRMQGARWRSSNPNFYKAEEVFSGSRSRRRIELVLVEV